MKVENCIENSVAFSSVIPSELTKFPVVTNSPSLEKNYSSVDIVVFWCDSLLPPGIWEEFLRKGKLPAGISRRSHFSMDNLEPGRHCSRSGPNSRALSGEWSYQGWGVASQRTSPEQLYVSEWLCSGFLGINPQRCGISLELDLQRWVERACGVCCSGGCPVVSPQAEVTALQDLHSHPILMLIMIKTKQFHASPSSLHNAGILATCPVVHNQPKPTWFSKILLLWVFGVCPAQSSGWNVC